MYKDLNSHEVANKAYAAANTLSTMIADFSEMYDGYDAPEEDVVAGGKYALGRLLALADANLADEILPMLREASFALVRFADQLEAVAIATRDNPDWWKSDVTATLYDLKAKGQLQDAEGRILLSFGEEDEDDQVEGKPRRLREDIVVVEARIKETKEQIAELDEELALERAARDNGDPDFIEAIFQQLEHERETYGVLLACDEETLEQIRAQLDDEDDDDQVED